MAGLLYRPRVVREIRRGAGGRARRAGAPAQRSKRDHSRYDAAT